MHIPITAAITRPSYLPKRRQQQQQPQHQRQIQMEPQIIGLNGNKFIRGMTDHSNTKKSHSTHINNKLHYNQQKYPDQYQPHQQQEQENFRQYNKLPLTTDNYFNNNNNNNNCNNYFYNQSNNSICNDSTLTIYRQQLSTETVGVDGKCQSEKHIDELTNSNLRDNVQIVLNNLNRNALRCYLTERLRNQQKTRNKMLSSPESDCNSNPHHLIGGPLLGCSIASSQDFTHDNSDYQWFIDYGYRDGVTHQSILSSLSASYNGIGELSYYEDWAKNIDANLAEVDMESFTFRQDAAARARRLLQHQQQLQLQQQQELDLDNSICKSKQLFSPVKETILSVDSLDMDGYGDDADIILTCQANKDNYTIAFEGSTVYSDESFYDGIHDGQGKFKLNSMHMNKIDDIVKKKALEVSMSRSDTGFTTWSKLKKNSSSQLQRYPSGNNNTSINTNMARHHAPHCFVRKSSSLPNLQLPINNANNTSATSSNQLHVSQAISTSTVDSYGKMRTLLPMFPMPISSTSDSESPLPLLQQSNSSNCGGGGGGGISGSSIVVGGGGVGCAQITGQPNQPSFNLVKLFIKQKSNSTDTCMDVSSGCWPSDSSSSLEQRQRKKSMNDSGKGSALSRHDEDNEDFQYDSLDVPTGAGGGGGGGGVAINSKISGGGGDLLTKNRSNDLYREVFDSPSHRNYKECNLNIRNNPKNQQLMNININNNNNNNNNNSMEKDSLKETNRSLSDTSRTSENITQVFTKDNKMDVITRSMQTSMSVKERVKVVPPSFLAQLNMNNTLGEQKRAPVYVIYPNYALPDLGFVNQSDIILSPISYNNKESSALQANALPKSKRPQSLADADELLKRKDFKHIEDWQSLAPLLPIEYRQLLKNIPEVDKDLCSSMVSSKRPMFCMTPPIRRSRPVSCDCANYNITSSGGSSSDLQPPSSGFRGSSTLLTDSEFEQTGGNNNDPMRNLYVYQYENHVDSESSSDRPPSGRVPRGILRRSSTKTKSKRNSMFEEDHIKAHNLDKRRSLQEQPYLTSQAHNIIEDYLAEINDYDEFNNIAAGGGDGGNCGGGGGGTGHRLNNSRVYNRQTSQQPHFYDSPEFNTKAHKTNLNYIKELTEEANRRMSFDNQQHQQQQIQPMSDVDARNRAEHFLSNVPKSELKYYAEVANILESIDKSQEPYDRFKLRNEVSRALSQKKVSFNGSSDIDTLTGKCSDLMGNTMTLNTTNIINNNHNHNHHNSNNNIHNNNNNNNNNNNINTNLLSTGKEFTTPPNSPNISITALRMEQQKKRIDQEKHDKIQSNRFKRLQIQWELLSKESSTLENELVLGTTGTTTAATATTAARTSSPVMIKECRSGGSTPTSANGAIKSKIPRPVSYPATKSASAPSVTAKTLQSPSRLVAPKKYGIQSPTTGSNTSSPTPRSRTPNKLHNTPKKTTPTPRTTARCTR